MKTVKKLLLSLVLFIICFSNLSIISTTFAAPAMEPSWPIPYDSPWWPIPYDPGDGPSETPEVVVLTSATTSSYKRPYDPIISTTINDDWWLESALLWNDEKWHWASLFNNQIFTLMKYVINLFIVIWIAVAFFWWYKILTSDSEDATKEWIRLVIYGILWIIIMISARFIATSLVWGEWLLKQQFDKYDLGVDNPEPSGIVIAKELYNTIIFPFIKIALYMVVWVLFVMMVAKVISFVTSTDEWVKKKAWWVIIRCVIGILIVMWSKQLVEAIMWKQEKVLNENAEMFVWWELWIWNEIMQFESIPIIVQVINRVMWLTMLVLVILVILQWYKMFAKPDDTKNREDLKKTILYIVIWVLVIGAAYVISNVLVINKLPDIS